jgi:nitroreductase
VPDDILVKCVDAARLSPSGCNYQPLKYIIANETSLVKEIFSTLKWARWLPDYGPEEAERPRAYIVMLFDKNTDTNHAGHDAGIAAMSISMVAYDEGLGSCLLGAINREQLREILNLPSNLDIVLVIALGYPAEKPVVDVLKNHDIKYWLDENEVLHVPKRAFKDIVHWNRY